MDHIVRRSIEFYLKDSSEPIWVITDTEIPLRDDQISIQNADGTSRLYVVKGRTWMTAKQGESSFASVRLIVEEVLTPTYQMVI